MAKRKPRKPPARSLRRSSLAYEQGFRAGYRHGFDDALTLATRQQALASALRNRPAADPLTVTAQKIALPRGKPGRPPRIDEYWRSVIRRFDSIKPVGRTDAEFLAELIIDQLVGDRGMLREKAKTLYDSRVGEGPRLRAFNKTLQNALGRSRGKEPPQGGKRR